MEMSGKKLTFCKLLSNIKPSGVQVLRLFQRKVWPRACSGFGVFSRRLIIDSVAPEGSSKPRSLVCCMLMHKHGQQEMLLTTTGFFLSSGSTFSLI